MRRIAFLLLFALAACASADSSAPRPASVSMQGWRLASGELPTKAEFGAVVASCQDRARAGAASFDSCLTELGLRHSQ